MTYQSNGTTIINTNRVFANLAGYNTNVANLGNQVGSSTTNLNVNTGSCFVMNFTTDHTSAKTLAFTNIPAGECLEAVIFVTNSTGSGATPGALSIIASGWTVRSTDGQGWQKPLNGQQDAYSVFFFGPTSEMFVTYAMRNIS